jgi:uncharacterized protein (TIGR03000 family)
MYTAVLMMALTASAESVDFGHRSWNCSFSPQCTACSSSCSGCYWSYGPTYYTNCFGYHSTVPVYTGFCGCSNARTAWTGCSGCSCTRTVSNAYYSVPVATFAYPSVPTPATIVVRLPADARLTFNGAATHATGERRSFVTPDLNPASTYSYALRAEMVRDGKTMIATREVTVRAGITSSVELDFSLGSIAVGR